MDMLDFRGHPFPCIFILWPQRCQAQSALMFWVPGGRAGCAQHHPCQQSQPPPVLFGQQSTLAAVTSIPESLVCVCQCWEQPCPARPCHCQALRAAQAWLQSGSDFPGVLQVLFWLKTTYASVKLPDWWPSNICMCLFILTNKDHSGYLNSHFLPVLEADRAHLCPHSSWAPQHL